MYCVRKVNEDYTWVGADGRRLPMFEGVYDVPKGVSFNSYLLSDERTVLFDTADAAVGHAFRENVAHALGGRALDYLVVHHMEPDHAAEIEEIVLRYPNVQVLCSAMARNMIVQFFGDRLPGRSRGQGGRHALHRPPHAAVCGRADGALARGAHDL